MNAQSIMINRAAQGKVPMEQAVSWFEGMGKAARLDVLNHLRYFCLQAHPLPDEVELAITLSSIKPTMTACVLLQHKPLGEAIDAIVNLPENEQVKSFKVLVSLLAKADARRRRTTCSNGCSHEWHQLLE